VLFILPKPVRTYLNLKYFQALADRKSTSFRGIGRLGISVQYTTIQYLKIPYFSMILKILREHLKSSVSHALLSFALACGVVGCAFLPSTYHVQYLHRRRFRALTLSHQQHQYIHHLDRAFLALPAN
jgi:hypothetical protein